MVGFVLFCSIVHLGKVLTNGSDNRAFTRAEDKGAAAVAAKAATNVSRSLWDWVERHRIDALLVLGITLWLSITVVDWAMGFADTHYSQQGMHIAAIIGAVLTPWGIMQAAMFKFYVDLKAKDKGVIP